MSSYYMCDECYEIFDGDYLNHNYGNNYGRPCPIASCEGTVFEIDELMIEPIRILNLKGYSTQFCCSGHAFSPDRKTFGYIKFHSFVELPESVPDGWTKDGDSIKYCIEPTNDVIELRKLINKKIEVLLDWAINLEDFVE